MKKAKAAPALRNPNKPVFMIYLQTCHIPRYYHKHLSDAVQEAQRLARQCGRKAFLIEYGEEPVILGHVTPAGEMVKK